MSISPNQPIVWTVAGAFVQRIIGNSKPSVARRLLGGAVQLGSLGLAAWGASGLVREDTTLDPSDIDSASSLVTTGANAVSRHPMYTAMLGYLLGGAIQSGRLLGYAPLAAVAWRLNQQASEEENSLIEKFGRDFLKYQDQTPKWL